MHVRTRGVLHRHAQGGRVLGVQLEDVADLDAAHQFKGAAVVRRLIPGGHVAQVRDARDFAHIALPIRAHQVLVLFVGAADEAGQGGGAVIDNDGKRQIDRADAADADAERGLDLVLRRKGQRAAHAVDARGLRGVELVVAAQHQRH